MNDKDFRRFIRDYVQSIMEEAGNIKINLPRYICYCQHAWGILPCKICHGRGWIDYFKATKTRKGLISLGEQVPQCHVCTRFETEDNPLFAYSYLQKGIESRFIYRCKNGHIHDHGMSYIDILTGLEVRC